MTVLAPFPALSGPSASSAPRPGRADDAPDADAFATALSGDTPDANVPTESAADVAADTPAPEDETAREAAPKASTEDAPAGWPATLAPEAPAPEPTAALALAPAVAPPGDASTTALPPETQGVTPGVRAPAPATPTPSGPTPPLTDDVLGQPLGSEGARADTPPPEGDALGDALGDAPETLERPAAPAPAKPTTARDAAAGQETAGREAAARAALAEKINADAGRRGAADLPRTPAGPTETMATGDDRAAPPPPHSETAPAAKPTPTPILADIAAAMQTEPSGDAALETLELEAARRVEGARTSAAASAPAARGSATMDAAGVMALAAKIAQRVGDGATRFAVRLDPPELGRVDVRLQVEQDGVARAQLTVERPEALSELSRHARALERALQDAGVSLARDGLELRLAPDAEAGDRFGPADDEAGGDDGGSDTGAGPDHDHPPPEADAAPVLAVQDAHGFTLVRHTPLDLRV